MSKNFGLKSIFWILGKKGLDPNFLWDFHWLNGSKVPFSKVIKSFRKFIVCMRIETKCVAKFTDHNLVSC